MTYKEKLEECGIKVKESATEEEAKEAWNTLAEIVDKNMGDILNGTTDSRSTASAIDRRE